MVIEVSALALKNAAFPIDVRELVPSNATEVSAGVSSNAEIPIEVTLAGMVIEVSALAL
jgi:hypothetical protein